MILGQAVPRGEVVSFNPIGIMEMVDDGEEDYKVIAVMENSPLSHVESLSQLQKEYPGIKEIIEIWFSNYKGTTGNIQIGGWQDEVSARAFIEKAHTTYLNAQ